MRRVRMAKLGGLLFAANCAGPPAPAPSPSVPTVDAPVVDESPLPTPGNPPRFSRIVGEVTFTGEPPPMEVPDKRLESEWCRDKPLRDDAVRVHNGRLPDTMIVVHALAGAVNEPPDEMQPVDVHYRDCRHVPRVAGALVQQTIAFHNGDETLHNINIGLGDTTLKNTAQPRGAPPVLFSTEEPGVYRVRCDVHPWERAFLFVFDHPYFDVSDDEGMFGIGDVPVGEYRVEAIHPMFGSKMATVRVEGHDAEVRFAYDGTEPPPPRQGR